MSKTTQYPAPPPASRSLSLRQSHNLQTSVLRDDAEELDNDALDIRDLLRVVLKYKWLLLAMTLLCGLAATIQGLRSTPMYSASVLIQIDPTAQRVVDFTEDVDAKQQVYGEGAQLQTQIELLKSRGLAERMVDEMGLDRTRPAAIPLAPLPQDAAASAPFGTASAPAGEVPGVVDRMLSNYQQLVTPSVKDAQVLGREDVVAGFMQSVKVEPVRNTRLVKVNVVNSNAELSSRIANNLAKTFIAMNLERKMGSSVYAKTFLEDQIKVTKAKLEESERVINEYAKTNSILVLDEKTNVASQNFADFSAGLSRVEQERIKAESLYQEVLRNPGSAPQVLDSKAVQAYKEQKAKLEAEYATNISVYKPDFPKMVQIRAQITELDARIKAEINNVLVSIKGQYDAAKQQEALFRARLGETRSEVLAVQDRSVDLNLLKRELDTNRQVYDSLLQRLKQVSVTGGLTSNNISVVDEAMTPLFPFSPNLLRNAAIGMGVGLLLALGLVFLRENLDDSVRRYDELEAQYGLPLLGLIPKVKKKAGESVALVAHHEPRSQFAEAYRSMRTALQFSTTEGAPERLMVTSCGQGEAKSTTALALAINFAQLGRQVLLIDADMRNPSLHKTLKLPNEAGLSNFLSSDKPCELFIQPSSLPNLSVILSGPNPPDPVELLMGPKFMLMLDRARELGYTQVIFDTPPVLGIADAIVLGNQVQHIVFAVKAGSTRKSSIKNSLRRLHNAGLSPMGVVMTHVSGEHGHDYGYESYYGYGDTTAKGEQPVGAAVAQAGEPPLQGGVPGSARTA